MKENISFSRFCDAFEEMNRTDNFSYEGKEALYNWLIELEEDTGQETELDIIALCCEFTEYKDIEEYLNDFKNQHEPKQEDEDDDDFKQRLEEEITYNTTLIKFSDDLDDGFIIGQ